jgi:hypothetical protein
VRGHFISTLCEPLGLGLEQHFTSGLSRWLPKTSSRETVMTSFSKSKMPNPTEMLGY